jgi:hypothetical protein
MKLFFVVFLILTRASYAEVNLAVYGLQSPFWNCAATLSALSGAENIGVSVLWNTFGKNLGCFSRILENPHTTTVQLHLINEVCAKHRRCGKYEFLRTNNLRRYELKLKRRSQGLLLRLRRYFIPAARAVSTRRPGVRCLLSPGLESMLSPRAARPLFELAQELFPGCDLVWNPSGASQFRRRRIPGTLYEFHGASPGAVDIANLDGDELSLVEMAHFLKRTRRASHSFLWAGCMNGIRSRRFVDPRSRRRFCSALELDGLRKVFHPLPS